MTVNKNSPPRPRMTKSVLGQGQQQMTTYIAIFKAVDGNEYLIEYRPCYDEIAGGIEVLSIQHTKRPHTWKEQRAEYVASPTPKEPRQLDFLA
jgi:hypothetical protein